MTDEPSRSSNDGLLHRLAFPIRFLARNWLTLLVDAVVIAAWVVLLAVAFERYRWPLLTYYLAMIAGIVLYTLLRSPLDVPS